MTDAYVPGTKDLLLHLGYKESNAEAILYELDILLKEIGFDNIERSATAAVEAKDTSGLISTLKDLMVSLENRGYYRPDAPTKLIRLLVNGLDLRNEDIFALLELSEIPEEEKRKEQEFLASCAAITQLGYIFLSRLVPRINAASSGPHVFLVIDGFSHNSMVFVDFSIDSIKEFDARLFSRNEDYYSLKTTVSGLDEETSGLLMEYYSLFRVTSGIGLGHNIHNNLGIAYDKIGKYAEAVEEFRGALRLDPAYIEVHNNIAVACSKMELIEEAINELEAAIRFKPEYAEAHSNLGNIYVSLGRYEEAVGELETALRYNPGYAGAHNALGNIYAEQGRVQDALREFLEAVRLSPNHALAHNNLGNIYAEQGKYEDALREFLEALRLSPEFSEAYCAAGLAYYNLGSYERAIQALVRAACLDRNMLELVPDRLMLKVRQGVSRLSGRM
jgi:tetratricopeptide (TPR) repeat protein